MPGAALKLHNEDNVLIALRDLHKGEPVDLPNHHFLLLLMFRRNTSS